MPVFVRTVVHAAIIVLPPLGFQWTFASRCCSWMRLLPLLGVSHFVMLLTALVNKHLWRPALVIYLV